MSQFRSIWDQIFTTTGKNTQKPKHKEVKLWHLILISPVLTIVFLAGLWIFGETLNLKTSGTKVEAEITEVRISENDDGINYQPTFRFLDASGKTYEKESFMSSSTPYQKGQIVEVLYLEKDPAGTAKINTFLNLWLLPILLLAIAGITELSMIFAYLAQQKKGPTLLSGTQEKLNPLLLTGALITSRYWQTVPEGDEKKLEVQYVYENQSYKTRSRALTDRQLSKLKPGQEVKLRIDPRDPSKALVII